MSESSILASQTGSIVHPQSSLAAPKPLGEGGLSAPAQADPSDIQWLTNNPTPSNVAQFEKVYGPGSSDSFFNPKMPSQQ